MHFFFIFNSSYALYPPPPCLEAPIFCPTISHSCLQVISIWKIYLQVVSPKVKAICSDCVQNSVRKIIVQNWLPISLSFQVWCILLFCLFLKSTIHGLAVRGVCTREYWKPPLNFVCVSWRASFGWRFQHSKRSPLQYTLALSKFLGVSQSSWWPFRTDYFLS